MTYHVYQIEYEDAERYAPTVSVECSTCDKAEALLWAIGLFESLYGWYSTQQGARCLVCVGTDTEAIYAALPGDVLTLDSDTFGEA